MAPPPPSSHQIPPPAPYIANIPQVLLEDIFIRLPTAADLARASTACASFRRVIAGHAFQRRYRALHPPPLIGMFHKPLVPAQPPHPCAAAAAAFADFNFSCSSFLPSTPGRSWSQIDFFDGRALLAGSPVEEKSGSRILLGSMVCDSCYRDFLVRDLAVSDPVHRRYVLLPAVPGDLKELIHRPDLLDMETFLAPGEYANLVGVDGGYLLIEALYTASPQEKQKFGYFSVDVKTLQVELFAALSKPIFPGRLYASFPPSLCAPTI